jgi:hypothetical protein
MNFRKTIPAFGTMVAAASILTAIHANPIPFGGLSPTNIQDFGSGPQWTSGDLSLPAGTTIGPGSSIELDLSLTGNVTTIANGGGGYAAGIIVDPAVAPGAEIFGFSYQLLENGSAVGSPFGFDLLNPFGFPVTDVSSGFGGGGPGSLVFNGVDVTVYNNTQVETVTDFTVFLSTPPSVPDSSSTSGLLILGVVAIVGIGYRKASSPRGA